MIRARKKVIFSSYDDVHNPYYGGGGAHAVTEVAKRLAPFFDVTILTANYPDAKNIREDGVRYKRVGPSFVGPKVGQLIFSFLLPWYVVHEEYDVWLESFTPPFSSSFLPLFTKKPVIGLVHMLASEDMERRYKLPFHLIEDLGLKTYRYFLVLSTMFKKKIQRINTHATIFVIPNGIDKIIYKKNEKKEKYLLFLGRIEYDQKGLDLVIESYRKIADKLQTKLVIAGSGLPRDVTRLKQLIHSYQLQDKVELVGKVTGKEKDRLIKNAMLLLIPSRYETFSLVVLEAMAYGKPVVSFAIDGLTWLPKDCILQVEPFDVDAYAQAIYHLATHKKLRRQYISRSQEIVHDYSWTVIFKQYKDLIDQLVSNYD